MPEKTAHPSQEKLSAYNLGQLTPDEAVAIEQHIGECQPCCETIVELTSDDTFMELLKEARELPTDHTVVHNVHGDPATFDDPPAALAQHPRYEVVELIGRGGMGDVFKARHRMMDRAVALKIIKREYIRKPEAVDRFHREVKAAAQLSHPNIVAAYDAEQANDVHFLVMEFVDGIDLSHIVRDRGALSVSEACDYIRQAAVGLQHAHDCRMVHRDIKPHNLMVTADGTLKILDFGLASLATETVSESETVQARGDLTVAGAIMGTPDFISPEQAEDARQADIRSDIYSLGATLYFLLSGRPPFPEGSVTDKLRSHAQVEAEPLASLREEIPADLSAVVTRMIAKDPEERYQTPADVAEALVPFAAASQDAELITSRNRSGVAASPEPQAGTRGWARKWAALACLCLIGGVGALLLFQTIARRQRMNRAAAQLRTYLRTGKSEQMSLNSLGILLSHPDGYNALRNLDREFDQLLFTETDLPHGLDSAVVLLHDDRISPGQPELSLRTARRNYTGGQSVTLPRQLRVDAVQLQAGSAYEQKAVIRYSASTERRHRQAIENTMQLKPGAEYTVAVALADFIQDRVDWSDIWRDGKPTGSVAKAVSSSSEPLEPKTRMAVIAIKTMVFGLETHKLLHERYPTMEEGLRQVAENSLKSSHALRKSGAGVDFFLTDPWGHPYGYQVPGRNGAKPDLWSVGPDGKANTADDICSWKLPADATTARPTVKVVTYRDETRAGGAHRWKLLTQEVGQVQVRLLHIASGSAKVVGESQFRASKADQSTIDLVLTLKKSADDENTVSPSVSVSADGLKLSRSTASQITVSGPFKVSPVMTSGDVTSDEPTILFHRCIWEGDLTYRRNVESMTEASRQGADFLVLAMEWSPMGVETAEAASQHQQNADLANIQGQWQVTYLEEGGRVVPSQLVRELRHVFTGNTLTMLAGKEESKTTFEIDPWTSPKSIDIVEDGETKFGIYELDGETLKFCWEKGHDQKRPTAFVSESNSVNNTLLILKRIGAGSIADQDSSYFGSRLTIKDAVRNADGKVEITFSTMAETVWYCPGANATSGIDGTEVRFVRAPLKSKVKVNLPAARSKLRGAKRIVVDPKEKPIFLREGNDRKLIWSPDQANIIGRWRVAFSEDGGRIAPQESLRGIRVVFTKSTMTTDMAGRQSKSSYKLDPSTSPKSIDLTENGRTKFGIYDLQGDTLRVCFAEHSEERPKAFDSQPDSVNDLILMMKRMNARE